jgi:hypothetical protein
MNRTLIDRRRVLRGVLDGMAIAVGLPLLDIFLNDNGDALANVPSNAVGSKGLPLCFGSWFWPLGLSHGVFTSGNEEARLLASDRDALWVPRKVGANFEYNEHLQNLKPIAGKFNIYSGTEVFLDGKTLQVHYTPAEGIFTGEISENASGYGLSLDQIIAAQIGTHTRFRSIQVACDGNARATWSSPGESAGMNASEISPVALYTRLFGPGFADPNSAEFHPDPAIMTQKSALSAVADQRRELLRLVGANDRARLDEYFTSVRDLEEKLALELERPAPLAACQIPDQPKDKVSTDVKDIVRTHALFARLLAHALACGQTRVFNVVVSVGLTNAHIAGDPFSNHSHTHEEPVDPKLGYQPICKWFADQWLGCFTELVKTLDSIKEGPGTLLDRMVVMTFTDHGEARRHTAKMIPLLSAGNANGKMKNGLHVAALGQTSCRLGLTCLHALGIEMAAWATQSNRTDKPFSEVLS